jgi:hypothetical protein
LKRRGVYTNQFCSNVRMSIFRSNNRICHSKLTNLYRTIRRHTCSDRISSSLDRVSMVIEARRGKESTIFKGRSERLIWRSHYFFFSSTLASSTTGWKLAVRPSHRERCDEYWLPSSAVRCGELSALNRLDQCVSNNPTRGLSLRQSDHMAPKIFFSY